MQSHANYENVKMAKRNGCVYAGIMHFLLSLMKHTCSAEKATLLCLPASVNGVVCGRCALGNICNCPDHSNAHDVQLGVPVPHDFHLNAGCWLMLQILVKVIGIQQGWHNNRIMRGLSNVDWPWSKQFVKMHERPAPYYRNSRQRGHLHNACTNQQIGLASNEFVCFCHKLKRNIYQNGCGKMVCWSENASADKIWLILLICQCFRQTVSQGHVSQGLACCSLVVENASGDKICVYFVAIPVLSTNCINLL